MQVTELRKQRIEQILAHCPPMYRKGYLRVTGGKPSPRTAIKVMCLHCCGWERAESSKCTAYACPLWAYNPWRNEEGVGGSTDMTSDRVLEANSAPPSGSLDRG